ncbi:MAG: DNA-3-methyladenine glycosylase I [Chloroflexi bacterium]|nr:DNA-3-methyladenine glycosylase I [Chloroflexota bacterium]
MVKAGSVCPWALGSLALRRYHDEEWGVPLHDDQRLFEFLVLEGMQAGLSWSTVLAKRDRFRVAFAGFYIARVARFGARERARLLGDSGIIRNRAKIDSAIGNARAVVELRKTTTTLDAYLWSYVNGRTIHGQHRDPADVPVTTDVARALSADLVRRGFRFVGPTIVYSLMQATGMVNDHLLACPRYRALRRSR